MASSNPFRKSMVQAEEAARFPPLDPIDTAQPHTPPPRTSFREAPDSTADHVEQTAEEEVKKKKKPVKKVRVLTPPPLSPDSPEWPSNVPRSQRGGHEEDEEESDSDDPDPFDGSTTDGSDRESSTVTPTPPPPQSEAAVSSGAAGSGTATGPPGNPFSKTLQDMETSEELEAQRKEEGEALRAANADRQTLNVDAFRRLLMTGDSGVDSSQASSDAGGPSAQAWTPLDAPPAQDYSSSASEPRAAGNTGQQASKDKKTPPPPPSSRHGKTIKPENSASTHAEEPDHKPESSTADANKPLPQTPPVRGSLDSDAPFEADPASRQHEQGAPDVTAASSGSKKSAPAPPPRRGHGRTDTKTNVTNQQPPTSQPSSLKPADDDPSSRSSIDSNTARPDHARQNAPAPPPPRRPHAAPKQSASGPSPPASSSSVPQVEPSETSPAPTSTAKQPTKSSTAPPLPPARNSSSSRRPQSIHGAENAGRRSSGEGRQRDGMPPPPPPRRMTGNPPASGGRKTSSEAAERAEPGKGADILADLDALQREVDAMRGHRN